MNIGEVTWAIGGRTGGNIELDGDADELEGGRFPSAGFDIEVDVVAMVAVSELLLPLLRARRGDRKDCWSALVLPYCTAD